MVKKAKTVAATRKFSRLGASTEAENQQNPLVTQEVESTMEEQQPIKHCTTTGTITGCPEKGKRQQ